MRPEEQQTVTAMQIRADHRQGHAAPIQFLQQQTFIFETGMADHQPTGNLAGRHGDHFIPKPSILVPRCSPIIRSKTEMTGCPPAAEAKSEANA